MITRGTSILGNLHMCCFFNEKLLSWPFRMGFLCRKLGVEAVEMGVWSPSMWGSPATVGKTKGKLVCNQANNWSGGSREESCRIVGLSQWLNQSRNVLATFPVSPINFRFATLQHRRVMQHVVHHVASGAVPRGDLTILPQENMEHGDLK